MELSTHKQAVALYGEGVIGYIAGIVDGEGSIGANIYSKKRSGGLVLQRRFRIFNKNIDVLEACQMVLGGNIHQLKQRGRNSAPCYYLQISDVQGIKRAVQIVLPYLIIKYDVAKLMLELLDSLEEHYRQSHSYTPREMEIVTEMRALNKRGV